MTIKFDEYKKYFTLEEIKRVKAHKAEIESAEITGILEVLQAGREILKYSLTWGYNRNRPERTYFGDGIEINVEMWVYDKFKDEVQYINTGLYDICQICNEDDRNNCGFVHTFKKKF